MKKAKNYQKNGQKKCRNKKIGKNGGLASIKTIKFRLSNKQIEKAKVENLQWQQTKIAGNREVFRQPENFVGQLVILQNIPFTVAKDFAGRKKCAQISSAILLALIMRKIR